MLLHHILGAMGGKVSAALWLFVFVFAVEQILPAEKILEARGLFLNCVTGFFYLFATTLTSLVVASLLLHIPLGRISAFAVSDGGSLAKAFGLSFFSLATRDFFYYWLHRLQHGSKWLWAQHSLHHADEHMNITTSLRHHWLEAPLEALFVDLPILILFRPPIVTLGLIATALSLVSTINHMNFRFGLGRFSWLIATPQLHRIHHSRLEEHMDKNFAVFFPLWDVIFGTYYAPRKGEYPATGLSSGERVRTVGQALFLPFLMWRKIWRSRSAGSLPVRAADPVKILLLLACLLFSVSASAQQPGTKADASVFGVLKLGEPLALPECSQLSSGEYIGIDTGSCYRDAVLVTIFSDEEMAAAMKDLISDHRRRPLTLGEIIVSFEDKPILVSGELRAQVIEGNVEFVRFDTAGLATQDQVLAALKEKYGEPIRLENVQVKNSLGNEFSAVSARWVFDNLTVSFEAAMGRIDRGLVIIGTKKGTDFELSLAKRAAGPKL